jgi:DNA-binding MarR family transcriptional regulator
MMFGGSSPGALSARFTAIVQDYIADGPAERAERARRKLLAAIAEREPATLKQVAAALRRGEPAVSRSVDSMVRAGLIDRAADPTNRRRLAMRLSEDGRRELENRPKHGGALEAKLGRLAQSELRAIERAVEILER